MNMMMGSSSSSSNSASAPTSSTGPGAVNSFPMAEVNTAMLKDELSKYSYAASGNNGGREKDYTQPFTAAFERELARVVRAVNQYQVELEYSSKSLLTSVETSTEHIKKGRGSSGSDGHTKLQEMSQKVDDFVRSCIALQDTSTKSRYAMLEIAQTADRQIQSTPTKFANLVKSSFPATLNSVLVVVASDIYAQIRTAEKKLTSDGNEEDGVWKAPSSFQRTTTKYWVKEEQLTNLMLTCAGEAPLLVYGKKGTLTPKMNRLMPMSEGDKLWSSMVTPITSVYFDSPDMSMYKKRLARIEGAQLLRARWYGTTMPKGDGIIFLELKTHHEKWVANKSVKERAAVQERDMVKFLTPIPWTLEQAREIIIRASPTISPEELTKSTNLLARMHKLVVKHTLRSCVRSVYMRAAFQSAKSNDLRLTLDRNVTLVDETARNDPTGKSWCLSDDDAKNKAKAVVVPFEVFEVKLVGDNPMPQGLAALIASGVIEEAPKFSKFLSGAAAFNQHVMKKLPYWASNPAFAQMFGMPASTNENAQDYSYGMDPCDCYQLFGDALSFNQSSGPVKRSPLQRLLKPESDRSVDGITKTKNLDIAPKTPVRVEPKSYFANERTFIQWISASLLLLTVATIMMSNAQFKRTSAMIAFSAFFLVGYATFVYFRRIKLLSNGKGYGYIDKIGPSILALGVGFGIFAVFFDIVSETDILGEKESQNKQAEKSNWFSYGYDKNDKDDDDRRLGPSHLRRLISAPELPNAVFEVPGTCFRQSVSGTNPLTFEPNDATVDMTKNSLLIASTSEILAHPLNGGDSSHLAYLDNTELGGLTIFGDRIFALSGGPVHSELLELSWIESGSSLEPKGSWTIFESVSEINGLDIIRNGEEAKLYIGMNGSVHSYRIPDPEADSLSRVDNVNMKMINQGLLPNDTIASFHTFEGITYFMHSASNVLRAWDLSTGELLAEIPLPRVDGVLAGEWKGFTFERRNANEEEDSSLRGMTKPSNVYLHLAADAPPQIWTFHMEEKGNRGQIAFPACASIAAFSQN
eukprot:CAMPEP_0113460976 /NCGR_PEP_ID=MMETSP0014_2-20120614/11285_1 /TAXON_ID=2857 /ORGANISM="Nitzschia sp." /LENGTH=1033 /DNA_ID=CAMNT_0000352687 /DNA_START=541 /DNA_END=3642 /DNA_ORIENTATION=- /assembly_acc=CAM_ASM_000159